MVLLGYEGGGCCVDEGCDVVVFDVNMDFLFVQFLCGGWVVLVVFYVGQDVDDDVVFFVDQ